MDLSTLNQAEVSVIGALLIDPENVLPMLLDTLRPEDFGEPTLRHLFEAAQALYLAKKPVDPVTIGAEAHVDDYMSLAAAIMRATPTAANAAEYAEIVRNQAKLRALRQIGYELAYECRSIGEALELLTRASTQLSDDTRADSYTWRELAQAFLDKMDSAPEQYLDLGIPQLTKAAKVRPGHFVILGAENTTGKTALALQMAFAAAKSGRRVGFFSLETDAELLTQRIMAQQAALRIEAIRDRALGREAARRAVDVIDDSWDLDLQIYPAAGWSVSEIRARTLSRQREVVFIDYVQLIQGAGDNPVMQLREISIALHAMAQALHVTVIALSQITLPPINQRTGRRPEITRSNLNMSSQLANDADIVLLMYLSDPDDQQSTRVLKMDKNKDVGQRRMLLNFDGPRLTFSYQPPVEDSKTQASRERIEAMDRHREERIARAAQEQAAREATAPLFEELEGGKEDIPFE